MERQTIQKEQVYRALVELGNHPSADEVFACARMMNPRLSKATVYRILNRMADKGEILRVPVADGADRFDHTLPHHYHICCSRCGKITDLFDPELDRILAETVGKSDYEVHSLALLIRGLCPDCRAK